MDPIICCILGICCPPEQAREALEKLFLSEGLDAKAAHKSAEVIFANFDLAPAGSLFLLKDAIAKAARKNKEQP